MESRPTFRKLLVACLLTLAGAGALWAALPLGAGADPAEDLRGRIDRSRDREADLRADAATFGRLASKLARQVAVLQGKLDGVQRELDRRMGLLARTRGELSSQRRRHARLVLRLRTSRKVLAERLVELYKAEDPDTVAFVLGATSFADFLDRMTFLERVGRQDTRIIDRVIGARDDARESAGRLRKLVDRRRDAALGVQTQRDQLANLQGALAARQDRFARAEAAREAAADAERSGRRRLQRSLERELEAQLDTIVDEQRQSIDAEGPGGPWAIPWAIVECESGGYNHPPNWATASGYYQIITSTWELYGGTEFASQAYLASKREQDIVASRIWNGGAGIGNWDCAVLLDMI